MRSEMTLGRFATVVGAAPRWVQNAHQVLGLRRVYDAECAKLLGLACQLNQEVGIPLVRAYPLAREALAAWPNTKVWRREDAAEIVTLEVDLERYLSSYAVRLSLARTRYAEQRRGRPPKRRKRGVAGARAHGEDISLLQEHLKRTPAERLRMLEEALDFVKRVRVLD